MFKTFARLLNATANASAFLRLFALHSCCISFALEGTIASKENASWNMGFTVIKVQVDLIKCLLILLKMSVGVLKVCDD